MSKIVILGGGESGVGAALLAKHQGFEVFLSDQGQLKPEYQQNLVDAGISFEQGTHTLSQILEAQEIIISPGIPEKSPIVKEIKQKNISLVSEIEFASRYTNAKIIAITGSNGKTTTTLLTYHLLKEAGLKVGLAGNIGQSFAKQVMENQHEYYVLEISSFQLDRCFKFSPDVAVLLNITPDHLDRYEYQFENYIQSKFRIFQNAGAPQTCIYWSEDPVLMSHAQALPKHAQLKTISFSDANAEMLIQNNQLIGRSQFHLALEDAPLKGPHNAINMSAAILAAESVGIQLADIYQALKTFQNAPHRLEPCGTWNGVQFINDSKATNVDAVYYALNSFQQPIILLIGGVDKGNEYEVLDELIKSKVKGMICLGTDNKKLESHFGNICPQIFSTDNLQLAVQKSIDWAQAGDVVLLSPACASFDLFKNYEDRGNQFKAMVKLLQDGE
ncbi:UDP-N-acetylmuramoyl-L-alanine--D-glutamate ligase [Aquirufa rosea]|uniref:UDP-N-acetylmuramoylalanine--D-glutamate ligase n=1 Tax=Aquirufa rosea TaxID=2509241 RepID=A0A4Q1C0V7_9BACT|nr:UDP-N-acetylmuramoyl-L-alanine--D-glutamate ligase [Aquirufa rosea]RXK50773.1 UDP-N-acetylmuramoyl-L-alanine--D-glutamate ligase [Aquirufa rosea]